MGFLLLGIDSLIAGFAIGPIVSKRARVPLAALFGIADGLGFLLGAKLGVQMSETAASDLTTVILIALGLYLIVVAAGTRRISSGSKLVWIVPWALTLDNLTYGVVGDHPGSLLGQFSQQALSSGLLALIGLLVGVVLPRVVPAMQDRVMAMRFAGAGLVIASGLLLLIG